MGPGFGIQNDWENDENTCNHCNAVGQDYYSQPIESGLEIQSDWENDENDTMVHDVCSQQQQIQQSMDQSINNNKWYINLLNLINVQRVKRCMVHIYGYQIIHNKISQKANIESLTLPLLWSCA